MFLNYLDINLINVYILNLLLKLIIISINLLVVYRESVNLIGYITRRLFLEPEWALSQWAIESEAVRARGIIVLVKSYLVKKRSRLNIFRKLKLDFNPFLPPKHYKYGGRLSLLVGYNI